MGRNTTVRKMALADPRWTSAAGQASGRTRPARMAAAHLGLSEGDNIPDPRGRRMQGPAPVRNQLVSEAAHYRYQRHSR